LPNEANFHFLGIHCNAWVFCLSGQIAFSAAFASFSAAALAAMVAVSAERQGCRKVVTTSPSSQVQFEHKNSELTLLAGLLALEQGLRVAEFPAR
jgi:hypothetical protein